MTDLNWDVFFSLPGDKYKNFEYLCRALVREHYSQYGQFNEFRNQPGVEFHLKLSRESSLGKPQRWYGWQCKFHQRTLAGKLKSSAKSDIKDSFEKIKQYLPFLTDIVLWTPYVLSRDDQKWVGSLNFSFELHLWNDQDIQEHLNGPGILLREAYFGDLVLTPQDLEKLHTERIQPIKLRWLQPVHQSVVVERTLRRMLGEGASWQEMLEIGNRLENTANTLSNDSSIDISELNTDLTLFIETCQTYTHMLLEFHNNLANGNFDIIQEQLSSRKQLINQIISNFPNRLRHRNLPSALDATNALSDLRKAQWIFGEVDNLLQASLVAVLADAGAGKTQLSAQLTSATQERPAGILLYGKDLQKGQSLDDLASRIIINGKKLSNFEQILAALDAAGQRSGKRLPIIIDGLNEAENPKDWKTLLSELEEKLKSFPNILVACTLRTGEHNRTGNFRRFEPANNRETFAVMALPPNIRRLESEGFGNDTEEAIQKYFEFYKIDPRENEVPDWLFRHPLTLRIFCEVTNPEREQIVEISHFPSSLTPLFEEYVSNACKRITEFENLSYSYSIEEVESSIYHLGALLWDANSREVNELTFREKIGDQGRQWTSSLVSLLMQEGIIFRNPGDEYNQFFLTPVFDALGGHVVGDALLKTHQHESFEKWLIEEKFETGIFGEEPHPFSNNIFNSITTLAPRRNHGKQLWSCLPEKYRDAGLRFVLFLENEFIDEISAGALRTLLLENPKSRVWAFGRLLDLRASLNHTFNANFFNSVLKDLSVADRDSTWTEWIRENDEYTRNDVINLEEKWRKSSHRAHSDFLKAKWAQWYLSSTDVEFRDLATRALYWYGSGDGISSLFKLTEEALDINDPYIFERLLAVSYGVAMVHWDKSPSSPWGESILELANVLFKRIYSEEADCQTTHTLIQEYSLGIISIAQLVDPQFLPNQEKTSLIFSTEQSSSPFLSPEKIEKKKLQSISALLHVNFKNDKIGTLISRWRKYHFLDKEFKEIESQILNRILELGYSYDLFLEIDSSINSRNSYRRRKTDRYFDKFLKIAYFEMYGLRLSMGKLPTIRLKHRTPDLDIDPSFPNPIKEWTPPLNDLFTETPKAAKSWLTNGPQPDYSRILEIDEIDKLKGPWVLIHGHFEQSNDYDPRRIFTLVKGVFTREDRIEKIKHIFMSTDYPGNLEIPDPIEDFYTFAGEIPWSKAYANSLRYSNGVPKRDVRASFRYWEAGDWVSGPKIEMPVCSHVWEPHHSTLNQVLGAKFVSPSISYVLNLRNVQNEWDLVDSEGNYATLYREFQQENDDFPSHLLYLRADLLETYLNRVGQSLIWLNWGERNFYTDEFGPQPIEPSIGYEHIHRFFHIWRN